MGLRIFCFLMLSGISDIGFSQNNDLSVSGIASELLLNANAVIRNEEEKIVIDAVDKMTIYTTRTVTVLNSYGDRHVGAAHYYDNNLKIKDQRATIYDAAGKEIRKYKQKEFHDVSAVSSNDLYTDNRVRYLDYTPQKYPYTIVYEHELQNKSTVFIRPWRPVSSYNISVERASYILENPKNIPLRLEEKNMEGFNFQKSTTAEGSKYNVTNLPAYKREYLSPELENFIPQLWIALNEFSLVGVAGKASNWQEFGKWQYDNLLAGRNTVPEGTKLKIQSLTANAKTDIEKAELIYQYVQDNTRYISVQLGIGGWEPMLPADVDRLGYGDCKALTNYTKALLDSQGITSYYAVVHAGEERKDIATNFASMQGNHVILNIPQENEDVWLECTSQTTPFNYLGNFTDNRNVLLLKPEGGEIVKTKAYSFSDNLQETYSKVTMDGDGTFTATVKRTSKGVFYGEVYHLMRETKEKQILYYKNEWGHLQSLDVKEIGFTNNRKDGEFTEEVIIKGEKLASKAGKRLLLPINFFSAETYNVPRNSDRKMNVEIKRGYTYRDTFEFILPESFNTESIPEIVNIDNDFGKYSVSVQETEKEGIKLIEVVREYIIYDGSWPADSYNGFRDFMNKVNFLNNQKAVIITNN